MATPPDRAASRDPIMWSSRKATPLKARLSLEFLDGRITPSGLDSGPDPDPPPAFYFYNPPVNEAPQIVNFAATAGIGGIWTFSGDVVDESPGGLTVTLGGEPDSLQGVIVVTDANGHFSITVSLLTNGSDDGLATAQTVDAQGLQSNVASCNIHPS